MVMRCLPPGCICIAIGTIGAPLRSAKAAAPRGVYAGTPKKGTKTPSTSISWSMSIPRISPFRSTRYPDIALDPLGIEAIPCLSLIRTSMSFSLWSRKSRAITLTRYPRSEKYAPRSSQHPMCPVSAITPFPRSYGILKFSSPSTEQRSETLSSVRKVSLIASKALRPRAANVPFTIARTINGSVPGKARNTFSIACSRSFR